MTTIEDVVRRVHALATEGRLIREAAMTYQWELEASGEGYFEPEAYETATDEELIEDVNLLYQMKVDGEL